MPTDPTRRFFTPSETTAAWLRQDRCCRICGGETERKFMEGDHVVAFDGRNTVLDNLQALCTACNRRKGNRSMEEMIRSGWVSPADWGQPGLVAGDGRLRRWQVEALDVATARDDALIEACPGAGKTRFGLEFAHLLLESDVVTRVLVIAPTTRIVQQWSEAANAEDGSPVLPFAPPDWRPYLPLYEHWVGAAATYATLFTNVTMMAALAAEPGHRTLVIFDEVHHAGVRSAWGIAAQEAFRSAAHRIMSLTGTPFRTGDPIVFVPFDETGAALPDYRYGYSDALDDAACRPIQFMMMGGRTEFETPDGETHEATFDDDLTNAGASYRLRTALDGAGGFLPELLRRADQELHRLRATDPDAGGLAIAMDCDHAEAVAGILESITGVRPRVACSRTEDPNDSDAGRVVEQFGRSWEPWLIAVRMVSEGVDIPRLRVLAYVTNVRAELTFRQIMGRIVRTQSSNEDDFGVAFVPADPVLVLNVESIATDARTRLPQPLVIDSDPAAYRPRIRVETSSEARGQFRSIDSSGEMVGARDSSGRKVSRELYEAAAGWIRRTGHDAIGPFELAWLAASDPLVESELLTPDVLGGDVDDPGSVDQKVT